MSKQKTPPSRDRQSGKKAYRTPKVRLYGDIRQITQGASNQGNIADNKTAPRPRKTGI